MKKPILYIAIPIGVIICVIILTMCVAGIAIGVLDGKTNALHDDYDNVISSEEYGEPIMLSGVELVRQDISCGYAVIEMFSSFIGGNVTEESLFKEYGKVVTSEGKKFAKEMNKRFKGYKTTMHKYLNDSELLVKVYKSLEKGMPVPFEWAAMTEGVWTLHYSMIVGMDMAKELVTIANPYGYMETVRIEEFLKRTSFEAYENMPFFLHLGFAFGMFEKNTIFLIEKI